MKQVFVSWTTFSRRTVSMQLYFQYELSVLSFGLKGRNLKFVGHIYKGLEYLAKIWKTLQVFLNKRPQVIWLQLPPAVLLHIAHFYKMLFDRQVKIIADGHTAMFRAPWSRFPGAVNLLNLCDLVLVHSEGTIEDAKAIGVTPDILYVLEDAPAVLDNDPTQELHSFSSPWVLYPCSFNRDEPINVVLEAARLAPEITWVLIGNLERAKSLHDLRNIPRNVKLPGFMYKKELDRLLLGADVILGLNTVENSAPCVAFEAIAAEKPIILSKTKTIQKLFYKGVVYVDPFNPQSIAQGCQETISKKSELTEEVSQLREERNQRWLDQANKLNVLLTTVWRSSSSSSNI